MTRDCPNQDMDVEVAGFCREPVLERQAGNRDEYTLPLFSQPTGCDRRMSGPPLRAASRP